MRKPLPRRHRDRRSGYATERFQDALDGPIDADTPLAPEAVEKAKAGRERHALRRTRYRAPAGQRPQIEGDAGEVLLGIGAVVALLAVLFWGALLLAG